MIAEPVLDGWLHPERIEPVPLADIDRVSVRPPREPMKFNELQIVPESAVIIEQVFNDQSCIDDVSGIRTLTGITSW